MQSSICFDVNLPSYRGVEQLVARRAHNPKVVGSSPAPATQKPFEGNFRGFLRLQHQLS